MLIDTTGPRPPQPPGNFLPPGMPNGQRPQQPFGQFPGPILIDTTGPRGTPQPGQPGQQPGGGQSPAPAPQGPGQIQPPSPGIGGGFPINANFNPLMLPTRESQNQLMAQAAQAASPGNFINRGMGNRGIQSSSGVNLQAMAQPMFSALSQGALGAAKLGIDDQLMRDQHMMRGILGLGQADIGQTRAGINRERIGIDARSQMAGSFADILRSLGGMLGGGNGLLGSL